MQINSNHPALAGHFPNRPIIPGVVLLDWVLEGLAQHLGVSVRVLGVPSVKFLAPLTPAQTFHIMFSPKQPNVMAFHVESGTQRIVTGSVRYEPAG